MKISSVLMRSSLWGAGVLLALCGSTNAATRSEEHTSELQSRLHVVCRLLLEKHKLVDPSADRLELACPFPPRIFPHSGHPGECYRPADVVSGLVGHNVCIIIRRVGR